MVLSLKKYKLVKKLFLKSGQLFIIYRVKVNKYIFNSHISLLHIIFFPFFTKLNILYVIFIPTFHFFKQKHFQGQKFVFYKIVLKLYSKLH